MRSFSISSDVSADTDFPPIFSQDSPETLAVLSGLPDIKISPPTPRSRSGSTISLAALRRNSTFGINKGGLGEGILSNKNGKRKESSGSNQFQWEKVDEVKLSKEERFRACVKRAFRRKNIRRTFPILKWAPEYNLSKFGHDTIAGLTVALTVLPQALAYATVAGLPPMYGLYSSFVGPFVYIIFGSTPAINVGPSAIQSIMTYKYTAGKAPEYAVFLCFVTAVFTLIMGIFRMGFIANFISAPVISAFTSAVALTIIATQLKPLLGLQFPSEEFVETLTGLSNNISLVKKEDALLGLSCCVILIVMMYIQRIFRCVTDFCPKLDKVLWLLSVAKSALVMLGSTILVAQWYPTPNEPFSIVGHISPGLPSFKPPPFEIFSPHDNRTHTLTDILKEEASALFVVPLLGVIGHCTIAKVFAGTERVDAAQEILVIGISNLIASFFSSMPIGGSFSRTTVNVQSGVKTPIGGLITGILVILALEYLTPYFFYIPKASLAAVICVSCVFMVNPYIILPLWRSKKMDLIPWAVTFLVTLFAGLEYGIAIGILISALFLLFYSARPRVKVGTRQTPKGTVFIHILLDRSLTFPSVDYITNRIMKAAININNWGEMDTPVVVDCHHIQYADFTAAEGMRDLITNMNRMGYQIFFWKVKPSVFRVISGTMRNSDLPLFRCNTEEELDAVIDGVHRRLSMFHPFFIKTSQRNLPVALSGLSTKKKSDPSAESGAAVSAVSTGIFV